MANAASQLASEQWDSPSPVCSDGARDVGRDSLALQAQNPRLSVGSAVDWEKEAARLSMGADVDWEKEQARRGEHEVSVLPARNSRPSMNSDVDWEKEFSAMQDSRPSMVSDVDWEEEERARDVEREVSALRAKVNRMTKSLDCENQGPRSSMQESPNLTDSRYQSHSELLAGLLTRSLRKDRAGEPTVQRHQPAARRNATVVALRAGLGKPFPQPPAGSSETTQPGPSASLPSSCVRNGSLKDLRLLKAAQRQAARRGECPPSGPPSQAESPPSSPLWPSVIADASATDGGKGERDSATPVKERSASEDGHLHSRSFKPSDRSAAAVEAAAQNRHLHARSIHASDNSNALAVETHGQFPKCPTKSSNRLPAGAAADFVALAVEKHGQLQMCPAKSSSRPPAEAIEEVVGLDARLLKAPDQSVSAQAFRPAPIHPEEVSELDARHLKASEPSLFNPEADHHMHSRPVKPSDSSKTAVVLTASRNPTSPPVAVVAFPDSSNQSSAADAPPQLVQPCKTALADKEHKRSFKSLEISIAPPMVANPEDRNLVVTSAVNSHTHGFLDVRLRSNSRTSLEDPKFELDEMPSLQPHAMRRSSVEEKQPGQSVPPQSAVNSGFAATRTLVVNSPVDSPTHGLPDSALSPNSRTSQEDDEIPNLQLHALRRSSVEVEEKQPMQSVAPQSTVNSGFAATRTLVVNSPANSPTHGFPDSGLGPNSSATQEEDNSDLQPHAIRCSSVNERQPGQSVAPQSVVSSGFVATRTLVANSPEKFPVQYVAPQLAARPGFSATQSLDANPTVESPTYDLSKLEEKSGRSGLSPNLRTSHDEDEIILLRRENQEQAQHVASLTARLAGLEQDGAEQAAALREAGGFEGGSGMEASRQLSNSRLETASSVLVDERDWDSVPASAAERRKSSWDSVSASAAERAESHWDSVPASVAEPAISFEAKRGHPVPAHASTVSGAGGGGLCRAAFAGGHDAPERRSGVDPRSGAEVDLQHEQRQHQRGANHLDPHLEKQDPRLGQQDQQQVWEAPRQSEFEELRQRAEQLTLELEASGLARANSQRDAQRIRQASCLASEELNDRLKSQQTLNFTLRSDYDDSQSEISELLRARHKLQAQLEDCELAREGIERRLHSTHSQMCDFQMECDKSSSGLRHAQSQGDAMRRELEVERRQAQEVDNLMDVRQQLKTELLQCQGELLESRKAHQQDGIWTNQLRQENEQLLADCRAAGMLSDSLRRELRDTSDRATAQHAENCDLKVTLDNFRLELQRSQDTIAAAQRENAMLHRQLQQRTQPVSGFAFGREPSNGPRPAGSEESSSEVSNEPPTTQQELPLPGWGGRQEHRTGSPGANRRNVGGVVPDLQMQRAGSADRRPGAHSNQPDFAYNSHQAGGSQGAPPLYLDVNLDVDAGVQRGQNPGFGAGGSPDPEATETITGSRRARVREVASQLETRGSLLQTHKPAATESLGRLFHESVGASRSKPPSPVGQPPNQQDTWPQQRQMDNSQPGNTAISNNDSAARVLHQGQFARDNGLPGSTAISNGDSAARVLHQGQFAREQESQREKRAVNLHKQLMLLNVERQQLEGTVMKFPSNSAGRTIADRRQKREAEERLREVDRTLSDLRQTLRQVEGKG